MDIKALSNCYQVRKLDIQDIPRIYQLSITNPLYFKFCPPMVSEQSIHEDMFALPPHKEAKDKFYIGFFKKTELVAIMDLILAYPDSKTAFIGLFMLDQCYQGRGIGTSIIEECCACLKQIDFFKVRLGFVKGNSQSETFWLKCGFNYTGVEIVKDNYTVVVLEKDILN